MKHLGTQEIKTKRLTLRRFAVEDAQAMYDNWASDPEVTRYLTWPTHGSVDISAMVLESWVKSYDQENFYQWAIEFEGRPVGSIAVVRMDDRTASAEVGYCIGRNWWHRGIVSEAVKAVMDYLFGEVGVNRVSARHDPRNPNSGAVMRKCGMTYEGTLRQHDLNNQGICDEVCYSILRCEWENKEAIL